jgi:tRNA A37 threonylcarbamoyladenosine modification protein TsaB
MGWLAIDTRVNGHSLLSWVEGDKIETIQVEGKAARALPILARLVEGRGSAPQGILVTAGPGTFSSIRTGVLYANLCARLWKIPLVALSEEEASRDRYPEVIAAFQRGERVGAEYVAPLYDREPNITIPRTQA